MKIVFTSKDKLRSIISLAILVIGLLIIGAVFTPPLNPPQCEGYKTPQNSTCIIGANIGAGLVWLLGMAIAIGGGIALTASVVFALVAGKTKRHGLALLITALIIGSVVLAAWYLLIGASSIKHAKYQAEIQKRQVSFVQYKGMPNISSISGQTTAITTKSGTGNASSVTLDLHNCSPGAAKVLYATGVTHFAFSGVRKDKNLESFNASECVLYVGTENINQNWDGLLHVKCVWRILDTVAENQQEFPVTNNGIEFGKFPSNCTDLRTGIVPRELIHESQ